MKEIFILGTLTLLYISYTQVPCAFDNNLDHLKKSFNIFKLKHGKKYKNSTEEEKYFQKFCEVFDAVNTQNELFKSGETSFFVNLWMHSDLLTDEFRQSLTGFKASPQRKFLNSAGKFPSARAIRYKNYTAEGWVTPVQYQRFCGCCWAFVTTGALEGQIRKKTGTLMKLSEQNLIDCNFDDWNGNWGCDGGNMALAYDYIKNSGGLNQASIYSFLGHQNLMCLKNPLNLFGRVVDYVQINGDENVLKDALVALGPLAVAVDASLISFQNYKSGIYDDPNCNSTPNHAVLLVGFGTDPVGGDYWIIKNSWGTSWGEKGYMRLARNKNNRCRITFDTSCPIIK